MASDASEQHEESTFEDRSKSLLSDPAKKTLILQKLGQDDLANKDPANSEDTEERVNRPTLEALVNLTPSGKSVGTSWPQVPAPFWIQEVNCMLDILRFLCTPSIQATWAWFL